MGICISHSIGIRRGELKAALDRTEAISREIKTKQADKLGISFKIHRAHETMLYIDIGNCETLAFDFAPFAHYQKKYAHKTPLEYYFAKELLQKSPENYPHLASFPEQELLWSSGFSKTQYARSLVEHRWIAELIRSLASVARYAHVDDEGDYYHTLDITDAQESIGQLGDMMRSLGATLTGNGFDVRGNFASTSIKSRTK